MRQKLKFLCTENPACSVVSSAFVKGQLARLHLHLKYLCPPFHIILSRYKPQLIVLGVERGVASELFLAYEFLLYRSLAFLNR